MVLRRLGSGEKNGGLEYAFDLSSLALKSVMGEILVLEEGKW